MGSGGRLLAGRTEGGSFGEGFVDVMAEHRETLMTATHGMSEGRSSVVLQMTVAHCWSGKLSAAALPGPGALKK